MTPSRSRSPATSPPTRANCVAEHGEPLENLEEHGELRIDERRILPPKSNQEQQDTTSPKARCHQTDCATGHYVSLLGPLCFTVRLTRRLPQ